MPMNVLVADLAEVELARPTPVASTAHAAPGSSGIPSTRAKSLPRPPGSTPSTPSESLERVGDRADQPVAAERDRDLAGRRRGPRQLARVLEAARALDVVLEPEAVERRLRPSGSARPARPPPADGLTISDEHQSRTQRARAGRRRSPPARDRWRPPPASRVVTPVSTIARVEPGRGRAGQIGVEPVADDQRPPGPEPVERGAGRSAGRACRRRRAVALGGVLERRDDRAGARARARRRSGRCGRGRRRSSRRRPAPPGSRRAARRS